MFLGQNRVSNMSPAMADLNNFECAKHQIFGKNSIIYTIGLPDNLPHYQKPLPFAYESTGVETFYRDLRDRKKSFHTL